MNTPDQTFELMAMLTDRANGRHGSAALRQQKIDQANGKQSTLVQATE